MPVTDVQHDLDALTLTITADFAAPVERVWEVYADPRQLERVWGPPTCPATFVDHDLSPGGRMNYYMSTPEGERYYGYWTVNAVDGPRAFTYQDGFAVDETFAPDTELPESANQVALTGTDSGTRATYTSTYSTAEALEQVLAMGVVEGAASAINQIDDLVAA